MLSKKTILFVGSLAFLLFSCGISKSIHHQAITANYNATPPVVVKSGFNHFSAGANFLLKNNQNLWELYTEGDPLERGLNMGALTDSLLKKQERVFFTKIIKLVPSKRRQEFLRAFLKWYNRKLYLNVPEEFKTEIFGVSEYTSAEFNKIAPPYLRALYLHGAHDIGHALQDLALVGCSSFAAWGDKSEDGSLILGRNFDFYAGDEFAQDKIVLFSKPKTGIPFMTVAWPGMIGAVSGMNLQGLTVTINASKSKIPLVAKTPISLLTREILQYASTIEEAVAIAKKRSVFVSETIMIGSAKDKKAILIEIAPDKLSVFEVPNSNQLVCSNHFQSDAYKNDTRNKYQITYSHSQYRFDKLTELLNQNPKINPTIAASILRNREGVNHTVLGNGNEKALNQLLAHHGVIFKPEQRLVWVSSNPYQLGELVCYDLNAIFNTKQNPITTTTLSTERLNIPKDPFVDSEEFANYEQFRKEDQKMDVFIKTKTDLPDNFEKNYQSLNPEYWLGYFKLGVYYFNQKKYAAAKVYFEKAMTKEITTLLSKQEVEEYLRTIKKKAHDSSN